MNSEFEKALAGLSNMADQVDPIQVEEFQQRIIQCQSLMQRQGIDAIYLHAGTNLYYFTGLHWNPSERMVAAILPSQGEPIYIAPRFELDTLGDYWQIECEISAWDEMEMMLTKAAEETIGIQEPERRDEVNDREIK